MLIKIKNKISELSDEWMKHLCYGYSCDPKALDTIQKLKRYQKVIEDFELAKHKGYKTCLTPEAYDCLLEQLVPLVGKPKSKCTDVVVDDTYRQAWELKNPLCVSHERWEKWARITARELDIEFSIIKHADTLIFEIAKKIIPCDVVLALNVVKEANDLNLTITRTLKESRLDFSLLIEKTNADLDLETYLKLIDCNLSFDVVRTIYENDLSLEVSQVRGKDEVFLKTTLSKYNINDVNLDLKIIKQRFNYLPKQNKDNLLTDYTCR